MAERLPYFPFYPKDWIAATRHLSAAARGCYMDMLSLAWLHNGCEADPDVLRRSLGAEKAEWLRVWAELAPYWHEVDGRLHNRKLESVRDEATTFRETKSRAGQASVEARRKKHGTAQPQNSPNRTPNTPPNTTPTEGATDAEPALALTPPLLSEPIGSESERARTLARRVVEFDPKDPGPSPTRRRRAHAAWEGVALYVTTQQHQDFVGRLTLGGMAEHEADRDLRAWYAATEDTMRAQRTVPGENVFKFWDEQFAARPDVARAAAPKAKPSVADHNAAMFAALKAVNHG